MKSFDDERSLLHHERMELVVEGRRHRTDDRHSVDYFLAECIIGVSGFRGQITRECLDQRLLHKRPQAGHGVKKFRAEGTRENLKCFLGTAPRYAGGSCFQRKLRSIRTMIYTVLLLLHRQYVAGLGSVHREFRRLGDFDA